MGESVSKQQRCVPSEEQRRRRRRRRGRPWTPSSRCFFRPSLGRKGSHGGGGGPIPPRRAKGGRGAGPPSRRPWRARTQPRGAPAPSLPCAWCVKSSLGGRRAGNGNSRQPRRERGRRSSSGGKRRTREEETRPATTTTAAEGGREGGSWARVPPKPEEEAAPVPASSAFPTARCGPGITWLLDKDDGDDDDDDDGGGGGEAKASKPVLRTHQRRKWKPCRNITHKEKLTSRSHTKVNYLLLTLSNLLGKCKTKNPQMQERHYSDGSRETSQIYHETTSHINWLRDPCPHGLKCESKAQVLSE
ncbi:protein SOGA3-like [Sceloporus undulatus]|uniref:protein SOGA3-like n=1 Tax=Sceloporus undulatus TaxID=8520 RepID=UPI001C4DD6E5|nr:protein SOGA3-like [Sceloporus undulatus]